MVNVRKVKLVSPSNCKIKQNTHTSRQKITNGPIYDLDIVKDLIKESGVCVINEIARDDQKQEFNPELSDDELCAFILQLTKDDRVESERCKTSSKMTVDCDAYAMKWDRKKQRRWEYAAKIYVKFGFRDNNNRVLIISIHPSGY